MGSPRMKHVLDLHGGVNWSSAKREEWYDSPLSGTGEGFDRLFDTDLAVGVRYKLSSLRSAGTS